MIPRRGLGQGFAHHQAQMALWAGYGEDVAALNADHDRLHAALCRWLGIDSQSLREAAGEALGPTERLWAALEEDAVLHTQRWLRHAGGKVPE